jgi:NAD(P)-dependent dehydrogenase (short-subunit alcohol dehydrogenase family)
MWSAPSRWCGPARSLLEAAPQPGAVVNTSSIAAVQGIGSSVPYAASKGAMTTMTLSLARSLGPRIRVNAVCPGFIDTPWFKNVPDDSMARLRAGAAAATPLKVASTADDIAASAVFFASPASRHVTGETPADRRGPAPRGRKPFHALERDSRKCGRFRRPSRSNPKNRACLSSLGWSIPNWTGS